MKFFSVSSFVRGRYPLAMAAGLVLAAAFPTFGIAGFAWIAPALMLGLTLDRSGGESFRLGYVTGLVHCLASLYWLLLIPVTGFPILGWVALGAYLALYPATWLWLVSRVSGVRGQGSGDGRGNWLVTVRELASWTWTRRALWTLSCAAIWVGLETFLSWFLSGFPWNQLGASQYRILPLVQLASITGVSGISFLIVWAAASLVGASAVIIARPAARSVWLTEIILPLGALAAVFAFGFHQLGQMPSAGRDIRVTLVQPSIPQTLIWDQGNDLKRFDDLIRLSEQALTNETDVLIWPEAAVPSLAAWDTNIFPIIHDLVRTHHVWLILGSDDVGPLSDTKSTDEYEYYNASFLVDPNGEFVARYKKRQLVIFGEYIPLVRWLPFVKWFTPIQGGFTPGKAPATFEMEVAGEKLRASPLICFEDVFASVARSSVGPDTDFLVNLTNDGWFGESAAQWQQAASALFRAVENNRPLVRCTNNGLTGWYDARGRERDIFRDASGSIYGPGFLTIRLPLPPVDTKPQPTFFQRHGNILGWTCLAYAAAILPATWRRNKR